MRYNKNIPCLVVSIAVLSILSILNSCEGDPYTFRVFETRVLCKQPGKYIGWPSIAKAQNGNLLVVFSGSRAEHVSNDGKIQMVRSEDGGTTWSKEVTVFDTPIDDRDAGIICTGENTIIVSWFTGPYGGKWQGNWIIRSVDGGKTWGEPVKTEVTTPHGPIQLKDGRLLILGQRPHCSHGDPPDWNGSPAGSPYTLAIEESLDDGLTWEVISTFTVPENAQMLSYDEPHLVELEDGKLVAMFRDCNGKNFIRQAESLDGGVTWSTPYQTVLRGLPPHVIRLKNNWLVTVYGKRWEPFGEYACISRDGGRTWDVENEIKLSSAPGSDLGYPASAQLDDGSIWTVYYQQEKEGEKPCLMGTHWKISQ